ETHIRDNFPGARSDNKIAPRYFGQPFWDVEILDQWRNKAESDVQLTSAKNSKGHPEEYAEHWTKALTQKMDLGNIDEHGQFEKVNL
ncbi:hypothetical protein BG011_008904, partial [Mortierella polycephala]